MTTSGAWLEPPRRENIPPPDAGPDANPIADSGFFESGVFDSGVKDAAFDGAKDAAFDGAKDAAFESGPPTDAGVCGPPMGLSPDFHWGFNEGAGVSPTRDDSMAYAATVNVNGFSLVNGMPCGSQLLVGSSNVTLDLVTKGYNPSPNLAISFDLNPMMVGSSGTLLQRTPGH